MRSLNQAKIGDLIRPIIKREQFLVFKIIGENKEWEAWTVAPLLPYPGFGRWKKLNPMVFKNDERWEVVEDPKTESQVGSV